MTYHSRRTRARTYGKRLHDVHTRPLIERRRAEDPEPRDYLGRDIAPETELERRARDGDR